MGLQNYHGEQAIPKFIGSACCSKGQTSNKNNTTSKMGSRMKYSFSLICLLRANGVEADCMLSAR